METSKLITTMKDLASLESAIRVVKPLQQINVSTKIGSDVLDACANNTNIVGVDKTLANDLKGSIHGTVAKSNSVLFFTVFIYVLENSILVYRPPIAKVSIEKVSGRNGGSIPASELPLLAKGYIDPLKFTTEEPDGKTLLDVTNLEIPQNGMCDVANARSIYIGTVNNKFVNGISKRKYLSGLLKVK